MQNAEGCELDEKDHPKTTWANKRETLLEVIQYLSTLDETFKAAYKLRKIRTFPTSFNFCEISLFLFSISLVSTISPVTDSVFFSFCN